MKVVMHWRDFHSPCAYAGRQLWVWHARAEVSLWWWRIAAGLRGWPNPSVQADAQAAGNCWRYGQCTLRAQHLLLCILPP